MPIDVHAHYIPASLIAAVRERGSQIGVRLIEPAAGNTPALEFSYGFKVRPFFSKLVESAEERTTWLDEQKLDVQLVATWPDIYGYGLPRDQGISWHRLLNDSLGQWCRDHRPRFAFVASVPLPNGDDAAQELERAIGLGATAVMISSNVEGTNIGELSLDSLWAKAEILNLPILLHPVMAGPAPRAAKFALAQSTQYPFDTTLGIGSLLYSGVLDRFPRLTFVLSHGGGAFPYLAGRFDIMHRRMDRAAQSDVAQKTPSAYLPMLAYDSIVHAPKALRFLADLVGIDRLLLGTDYSFPPADLQPLDGLRAAGFGTADIARIADENPRRLFSRLTAI